MPTLLIRFPGGRYHATPWSHHVNEGLVEWPPSPWRVLRALISVGYTTLGWDEIPPEGRRLLEGLAGVLPRYRLPRGCLAQSHHYLPLARFKNGREDTTLVYDTWARVDEGTLAIVWDVSLEADEIGLLASLADRLAYLGRAESRVVARLLEPGAPLPPGIDARPADPADPVARSGPGWEQIAVLAPEPAPVYARWHAQTLEAALAPLPLPEGTRKPPAKLLKARARVTAAYPPDLLACLQVESGWLQRLGWSQPPGSRQVLYWRRADGLEVGPSPAPRLIRSTASVPAMLLELSTPTGNLHALPTRYRTLPQAELLHRALVSQLARAGTLEDAHELIGRDGERQALIGHRHAHILPLDLDGDGHLEHVLIWAPMGLGAAAQDAIRSLRRTFTKGGTSDLRVAVAGSGQLEVFRSLPGALGKALRALLPAGEGALGWGSLTPFVAPRFLKPRGANTLEGQVQAELHSRGLPPARIECMPLNDGAGAAFRHFVRGRSRGGAPPPMDAGFALRLHFETPIAGPLALGYGSHFGLGLFRTLDPAP